jgi:hypothetical protein
MMEQPIMKGSLMSGPISLPRAGDPAEHALDVDRLCFGSGVVAATLFFAAVALFVAVIVPQMPPVDAPAAVRTEFYAAMGSSAVYRSISYLGELQALFLLPFFGGLHGLLRRVERGSGAVASSVFAAGIALTVITPFAILLEDHLMLGLAGAGADSVTVAAIDGIVPLSMAFSGFPQAIVLAGVAILLPRRGIVPRWIGRFGLGVAVLSLIGTGTLVSGAMFAVSHLASLLARVWLLALSVVLLRRSSAR